ncbi:hypothetical protein PPERSA_10302 [Pseudocohnilembus persalinus]|uniref:P-loop containing nucleoside triphosphate hydrolase n=1 Tax=Pseudocohnilembus persalinus TaxID=266149 RepID=A0A0V0R0V0_PSEPJ|nr:hypothetical protein PPERSA_10302 [Pseudocohnilembus persalinus]|eukprot:KRX07914.1 hypothetical protein PPERSA_10302 [Pseudocohnilembus persalinus]
MLETQNFMKNHSNNIENNKNYSINSTFIQEILKIQNQQHLKSDIQDNIYYQQSQIKKRVEKKEIQLYQGENQSTQDYFSQIINQNNKLNQQYQQKQEKKENRRQSKENQFKQLYQPKQYNEIDKFLLNIDQVQDSLLIYGKSGQGKTWQGKKIEQYIWNLPQNMINFRKWLKQEQNYIFQQKQNAHNTSQNEINSQYSIQVDKEEISLKIPIIPIFIDLSILENPLNKMVEETLKSDQYNFDDNKIEQLKLASQNNNIKIVFIIDSYNELLPKYFSKNLYKSNKLHHWGFQGNNYNGYPKIITTCISETFNKGYFRWFTSYHFTYDSNETMRKYKEGINSPSLVKQKFDRNGF